MEETTGSSPNATGGVAIDSPLQNSRRLEHDDARGEIGTSLPVFGLRPIRRPFLRFLVMTLFLSGFRTLARTSIWPASRSDQVRNNFAWSKPMGRRSALG
jgi:hypothetical protein